MALERLVFPIPPAPKIAILGASRLKAWMIKDISDSRPWNIFGSGGSNAKEFVLDNMRLCLCDTGRVYTPVLGVGEHAFHLW
jgi:hypothetical protein